MPFRRHGLSTAAVRAASFSDAPATATTTPSSPLQTPYLSVSRPSADCSPFTAMALNWALMNEAGDAPIPLHKEKIFYSAPGCQVECVAAPAAASLAPS